MRVSPLHLIFTSGFLAVVVFAIDLLLVLSAPRIGVDLVASSGGLVQVDHVYRNSPAEDAGLVAGDLLVKVFDEKKNTVYLSQDSLLKDPDIFPTFALFNGFIQHQLKITRILKNKKIFFQKIDGSYIAVKPLKQGAAKMLPMWYWNIKLMGICILLIGAAIYAHNPKELSTKLLFIAAIGFFMAGVFYGVNGSRELASPFPEWTQAIDALKHLSLGCFSLAGIALLWVYPNQLNCRVIVWGATIAALLVWAGNSFQFYEFPLHTYYALPYLIPVSVGVVGSMMQYKASFGYPINKAVMLWMTASIWIAITVIFAFHIFPILNSGYPISDMVVHYMSFLLFIGFVLGITRYRLFDIDRWWFNTWLMFLVTLGVLIVDAGVAYALNVSEQATFIIALLLFFLVYFPLREKLWITLFRKKNGHNVKDYLSEIVTLFTQLKISEEEHEKYIQLFSFIYNPSDCQITRNENNVTCKPTLSNSGLVLNVPIDVQYSVIMTGKNRSRHLFDKSDESFSKSIVVLASEVIALTKTRASIETDERSRIMRDLHDDVGAGLLNIIHGSKDKRAVSLARETLQSLRLSIIPLYQAEKKNLGEAAAQWQRELENRLMESNISLKVLTTNVEPINIEVRVFINTTRILRELTSNLIKHSDTKAVQLTIDASANNRLIIIYDQLGNSSDPADWQSGTGTLNIESRIKDISGQIVFDQVKNACKQSVRYWMSIPLSE